MSEPIEVPAERVRDIARAVAHRMAVAAAVLIPAALAGFFACSAAIAAGALGDRQEQIGLAVLAFPTAWLVMICRYCLRTRRDARQVMAAANDPAIAWILRGRDLVAPAARVCLRISSRTRASLSSLPRAAVVSRHD